MALPEGRTFVDAPTVKPTALGLYSVAELRPAPGHDLMGIAYQSEAGFTGDFVGLDPESCISTDEKVADGFLWVSGTAVHLFAAAECTPLGNDEEFAGVAKARLDQSEEFLAERHFWENLLPEGATDITPGGTAVSPRIGLGLLEEYVGQLYRGLPTLHIGKRLGVFLRWGLELNPETLELALGNGYFATDQGPVVHHAAIATPVLTKGATAGGGTFAAGTYFWKITAINTHGETVGSNEITATLTANQEQTFTWVAIAGATGYKVYRGTVAGAENVLVATLGAVATYTDTGIAGTAGAVPTTDSTAFDSRETTADGEVWAYMSGKALIEQSEDVGFSATDWQHNDRYVLAERSIVPTVDGPVAAIKIALE